MAKGAATLIRVNEWTVDERRRELGARLRELDELETALANLEKEVIHEQQIASSQPEVAGFIYGSYADGVIHRREQFQAHIEAKEKEIAVARDALSEAYVELKKYEVVHENQRRLDAEEQARREQIEIDELGLQAKNFRERR